jgi:hypothetical protein
LTSGTYAFRGYRHKGKEWFSKEAPAPLLYVITGTFEHRLTEPGGETVFRTFYVVILYLSTAVDTNFVTVIINNINVPNGSNERLMIND